MTHVRAFLAGFLSTLVFHQGLLVVLNALHETSRQAYAMNRVGPLHVPSVISLAFWGGLWGVVLWSLIRHARGATHWLAAFLVGAVAPTLVAFVVVLPLKGMPVGGGWKTEAIVTALVLNGAWGIGVALFMRLFAAGRRRQR